MRTLFGCLCLLLCASCLPFDARAGDIVIRTAGGQDHIFHAEVARTESELENGLMFRTELAENAGMLFVFPNEVPRQFWMKNTLIPLDIIFIGSDGRIANIHERAKPHDLTPLPSSGPVVKALEIKGGRAADLGIKPGDQAFVK